MIPETIVDNHNIQLFIIPYIMNVEVHLTANVVECVVYRGNSSSLLHINTLICLSSAVQENQNNRKESMAFVSLLTHIKHFTSFQ